MKIDKQAVPSVVKRISEEGGAYYGALAVTWSDGAEVSYRSDFLRRHCPCADCVEERQKVKEQKDVAQPKFSFNVVKNDARQSSDLQRVWGVGNYAVGMLWGDGHQAGIYTYEYLRELAALDEGKK